MSLSPISQKAHDISFAAFRVATLIKNSKLRTEIESAAIDLVAHLSDIALGIENSMKIENGKLKIDPIERLESLVTFAESIGEMKPINASVLKRELGNLQTAIDFHLNTHKGAPSGSSGLSGKAKDKDNDIDISNMFLPSEVLAKEGPSSTGKKPSVIASEAKQSHELAPASSEISVRQTAILRNIREIEFCRLRNIMEAMPNVSERTIRNDIQGLIDRGLVRRVGGGGPNSYFETLELSTYSRQGFSSGTLEVKP